ncbi:Uncharacterised protein r2_g2336 [Pycnogonum litorale]
MSLCLFRINENPNNQVHCKNQDLGIKQFLSECDDIMNSSKITSHVNFTSSVSDNESLTNVCLRIKIGDCLSDDFLEYVDPHWRQYEMPSSVSFYVLGALYSLLMIFGITGNSAMIWIYSTTKSLRRPSNYFVVNLAVSDLMMNLKMPIFVVNSFYKGPALGTTGCLIFGFTGLLSGGLSIYSIAAMAFERSRCIYQGLCRRRKKILLLQILFIWTLQLTLAILPLLGISRYVPEGFLTSCTIDYLSEDTTSTIFMWVLFSSVYVVPLIIIVGSYALIFIVVVRQNQYFSRKMEHHIHDRARTGRTFVNTEMRLAYKLLGIIGLWLLSWTPYATVALLSMSKTYRHLVTPLASMIPAVTAKLSSIVDPFIYALLSNPFKNELIKRLTARRISSSDERESSVELKKFQKREVNNISSSVDNINMNIRY